MPAAKGKEAKPGPIYQLKITLRGSKPPIWRRVQVSGDITLYKLHQVIQVAMGWTDSHLHQFTAGGIDYGESAPEWGMEVKSERRAHLNQVAPAEKARFTYEYDFGDSWDHEILVEKIVPPEPGVHYPTCLTGKRACPPEDVGGIWGYEGFLESLRDPKHPEHDEYLEWVGGEFDPEAFDCAGVNAVLQQLR
jgi:hypothetical protein